MVDKLTELVKAAYTEKAAAFFEKLKAMNLTDKELSAVPSLFIPGWGVNYDSSCFKVAISSFSSPAWDSQKPQ